MSDDKLHPHDIEVLKRLEGLTRSLNILLMEASKEGERHPIAKQCQYIQPLILRARDTLYNQIKHMKTDDEWDKWFDRIVYEETGVAYRSDMKNAPTTEGD